METPTLQEALDLARRYAESVLSVPRHPDCKLALALVLLICTIEESAALAATKSDPTTNGTDG